MPSFCFQKPQLLSYSLEAGRPEGPGKISCSLGMCPGTQTGLLKPSRGARHEHVQQTSAVLGTCPCTLCAQNGAPRQHPPSSGREIAQSVTTQTSIRLIPKSYGHPPCTGPGALGSQGFPGSSTSALPSQALGCWAGWGGRSWSGRGVVCTSPGAEIMGLTASQSCLVAADAHSLFSLLRLCQGTFRLQLDFRSLPGGPTPAPTPFPGGDHCGQQHAGQGTRSLPRPGARPGKSQGTRGPTSSCPGDRKAPPGAPCSPSRAAPASGPCPDLGQRARLLAPHHCGQGKACPCLPVTRRHL